MVDPFGGLTGQRMVPCIQRPIRIIAQQRRTASNAAGWRMSSRELGRIWATGTSSFAFLPYEGVGREPT
jgi:hypothetical protein